MLSSRVVARRGLRSRNALRRYSLASRRSPRSSTSVAAAIRKVRALPYSTEQILKSRDSKIDLSKQKVLYDATNEKDSCGVGLIANLKSKPSRHVVDVADEMLVRMSHRGGCGCDPASGDGAGKWF